MSELVLKVKLFGPLGLLAGGRSEVDVSIGSRPVDCATVMRLLGRQHPELEPSLSSCRLAVNHEFAQEGQPVGPTDEVALVGMVSGG